MKKILQYVFISYFICSSYILSMEQNVPCLTVQNQVQTWQQLQVLSLRTLCFINLVHHLKNPENFFSQEEITQKDKNKDNFTAALDKLPKELIDQLPEYAKPEEPVRSPNFDGLLHITKTLIIKSADKEYIGIYPCDKKLKKWFLHKVPYQPSYRICFSPDNKYLATLYQKNIISIFSREGKIINSIASPLEPSGCFDNNNNFFSVFNQALYKCELEQNPSTARRIKENIDKVIAYLACNNSILVEKKENDTESSYQTFDIKTEDTNKIMSFKSAIWPNVIATNSHEDDRFAFRFFDEIHVYKLTKSKAQQLAKLTQTGPAHWEISCLSFNPTGKCMVAAAADPDHHIYLWNIEAPQTPLAKYSITPISTQLPVSTICWPGDDQIIAVVEQEAYTLDLPLIKKIKKYIEEKEETKK